MITELNKDEFSKCKHLINSQGQIEVKAVVGGINPARIFVDNRDYPNSGLIWLGNNDGFLFIGNEENNEFNRELNEFVDKVIVPEAQKIGLKWFEVMGNHPNWNKSIEKIFQHRHLGSWNQRVYVLEEADYNQHTEPIIEQEYSVHKISQSFYDENKDKYHNFPFLENRILESWSSIESFLNKGIGYVLVYEHTIVSVCISGFVADNVHCIDIETLAEHQRKKLAQKLAHMFVKECLDKGMIPYWDCTEVNKPSIAVAENVGFKRQFNYVGYEFSLE
ncbi:GNAT family N-acetyltransferase [Gracilibacillus sp. S3-1-1]|uniref:GNAT family N-acetyltransferase n=1 Tax=Gracilibacillus pellucidus TaxID=3095368 RepID=A0ACC6M8L3_9BACI|nr:GNAT family N-acetyltransferase [Gracilibacillus sp. S3-1-1]MDX8047201.1 GNAT family N-acetyltransferase [Gracilibacillus sp. S3-1-1]